MAIKYDKLFAMMKKKGLTTYRIKVDKIVAVTSLQRIREGLPVSLKTIDAFCKALNCQPGDLLEYVEDENKN